MRTGEQPRRANEIYAVLTKVGLALLTIPFKIHGLGICIGTLVSVTAEPSSYNLLTNSVHTTVHTKIGFAC